MMPIDKIITKSGKDLWVKVNQQHGSSTWGYVGDGIIEIEEEMYQIVADKIWQRHIDSGIGGKGQWTNQCGLLRCHCEELVEWLKNDNSIT